MNKFSFRYANGWISKRFCKLFCHTSKAANKKEIETIEVDNFLL